MIETARDEAFGETLQLLRTQLEEHDIVLTSQALERATKGLIEDHSRGRILTARLDGALAGVAVISFLWTLQHGGPAAWLDEVYVDPTRRGHGIGRAALPPHGVQASPARALGTHARSLTAWHARIVRAQSANLRESSLRDPPIAVVSCQHGK